LAGALGEIPAFGRDDCQNPTMSPYNTKSSGKPKPCGDLEIVHAHQG
jgi:hypothetical protein